MLTFLPGEELGGGGLAEAGRPGQPHQLALLLGLHLVVARRRLDRVALLLLEMEMVIY